LHACDLLRKIKTNQSCAVAVLKENSTIAKGINEELDDLRAISTSREKIFRRN